MKKYLLMVAVAILTAMNVSAQDELKSEVGVFIGTGSASDILSVYTGMFAAAAGDQSSFVGPIGAEYYYHLTPAVAVGGVAVFAHCKAEDEDTGEKDLKETFITLMPSVKINWLRKKHFGMYSALSAGVMFLSLSSNEDDAKDETLSTFMFQATALGMEFGSSSIRGFAELGLGEKGLLCAGLRYKF